MVDVPALILAGGLGTRLEGVVTGIPKVLAPVRGRPFLSYLLHQVQAAGVREVVLCTGYRADQVFKTFGTRHEELSLRYSSESRPLGTAGAIRQAIGLVEAERLLVLNGDSYIHNPLEEFHRWHLARESSFPGSLLLTWTENSARFGTVELGPRAAIRSFHEKRGLSQAGWINGGVYLLRRSLLESIPPNRVISLENQVFPDWIRFGLGGYTTRARFIDIGTPESYAEAGSVMAEIAAGCRNTEICLRPR
ncbi:MAG TPA: sugar phosphate nucleotidyltransferase [Isosphaeraceae bacterium]|nr:sugar phosphate nucleotidyltransferase [Isosphaeraceae bacterium]